MRFDFQTTAGTNPVQVSVKIELEQRRKMIRGATSLLDDSMGKPQVLKIQGRNISINESDRSFLTNIIFDCSR